MARFGGDLTDPDGSEVVGHQVYPLLDTESTTEPVPVYRPETSGRKTEQTQPSPALADAPTVEVSAQRVPQEKKKSWWPF